MGAERQRAEEFAGRLAEAYGDALVSVTLYGSAARGEYREGSSDLNLLVLLRGAEARTLRRGARVAREWAAAGERPPLVLPEAEWLDSADVFPIEYSDMRDAHVVLHGSDPFDGIRIEWRDLRLQCEHEIKAKQIRLRERYLLSADQPEELGALLLASASTFLTLFRSGLRLAGAEVPRDGGEVVSAIAERAGFDPAGFREVLRARSADGDFAPAGDGPVVMGYLDAVERTAGWLDQLHPTE
ncbi:MAG TPA: nucleotidyltransferase domain-containing protein [Longimicrobiaceae bacterium]|nr:nucleotidyltransferase domain-containing protein [Longimicrobiaceae bacterium]